MKTAKLFCLIMAIVLAIFAVGCDDITNDRPDDVVQTDSPPEKAAYPVGIGAQSFDKAPDKVVSLSPAITEAMNDLGVFDRLVAVSEYCTRPSGVELLPKTGNAAYPDIDTIISLAPELVIAHSVIASSDKVLLNQAGITVLELKSPDSFAELCEMYINLSLLFYGAVDSQDAASGVLSDFDSAMSEAKAAGIALSFVCVEGVNDEGLILSHGNTLESDILSVFGTNLREEATEYFVSQEDAKELSPDVVFYNSILDEDEDASDMILDIFGSRCEYIEIDIADFERPTVRLSETVRFLLAELS